MNITGKGLIIFLIAQLVILGLVYFIGRGSGGSIYEPLKDPEVVRRLAADSVKLQQQDDIIAAADKKQQQYLEFIAKQQMEYNALEIKKQGFQSSRIRENQFIESLNEEQLEIDINAKLKARKEAKQ